MVHTKWEAYHSYVYKVRHQKELKNRHQMVDA